MLYSINTPSRDANGTKSTLGFRDTLVRQQWNGECDPCSPSNPVLANKKLFTVKLESCQALPNNKHIWEAQRPEFASNVCSFRVWECPQNPNYKCKNLMDAIVDKTLVFAKCIVMTNQFNKRTIIPMWFWFCNNNKRQHDDSWSKNNKHVIKKTHVIKNPSNQLKCLWWLSFSK